MRMSCNGCRVLRKACSESCSIRPCLRWIKSPESQANATMFLAKFYGRAGLLNLLNAASLAFRPAVFRSLLYEACGRIVNPVFGSVGLLWSGNWNLCQNAVDAVLKGLPITPVSGDAAAAAAVAPPIKGCDVRHVVNHQTRSGASSELHQVAKTRTRFKRSGPAKPTSGKVAALAETVAEAGDRPAPDGEPVVRDELHASSSPSHDSSTESMVSVEVAQAANVSRANMPEVVAAPFRDGCRGGVEEEKTGPGPKLDLRLGLGFEPVLGNRKTEPKRSEPEYEGFRMELRLV